MVPLGAFIFVGGTYGVIQEIVHAYADGAIGESLSFHSFIPSLIVFLVN